MAAMQVSKKRLVLDCVLAAWNRIRMPSKSHRGPLPLADDRLVELASELRRHVAYLADEIGERNVRFRPRELAHAAEFVAAELSDAGYTVQRQEYDVDGTICANLEVEIVGITRPDEIVIIGAHYSAIPATDTITRRKTPWINLTLKGWLVLFVAFGASSRRW